MESNTDKPNSTESYDTSYYPLDELDAKVYSKQYHEARRKASRNKAIGIALLCLGVFCIVLYPILLFLINDAECQNDQYGWCGFAIFLNLSPLFIVGVISVIVGIIMTIHASRILKNKIDIRRKPF
jgi:O-antigen/teichoic acid export membrane protein